MRINLKIKFKDYIYIIYNTPTPDQKAKKNNKDLEDLKYTIYQLHVMDIYAVLHLVIGEYTY